jgi:hypothetical protein
LASGNTRLVRYIAIALFVRAHGLRLQIPQHALTEPLNRLLACGISSPIRDTRASPSLMALSVTEDHHLLRMSRSHKTNRPKTPPSSQDPTLRLHLPLRLRLRFPQLTRPQPPTPRLSSLPRKSPPTQGKDQPGVPHPRP